MDELTTNKARAATYRLLSACYYQPEPAFIEEDVFGQLEAALALHDEALAELAKSMDRAFRAATPDELLFDYTRLFLGPYDILAKPYGSIYLDGEKVVMGDSTMNALACYREGGFEVGDDFGEMPDHVAVELEFLYLLTFRENEALAADDPKNHGEATILRKGFLYNHLGRWVSPFCERIRQGARTDFYRQLADLTEGFVRAESERSRD